MILANRSVYALTSLRDGQAGYQLIFSARARDNMSFAFSVFTVMMKMQLSKASM
jgi:hypothetical protein